MAARFDERLTQAPGSGGPNRHPCWLATINADGSFDLVIEGEAQVITEAAVVADMAARWAAGGWPAEVDESGMALTATFSAPSAGPP